MIQFLQPIFSIIDKVLPDAKLATDAKQKILELQQQGQLQELQEYSKVVTTEAQGESWLQRNWRPGMMALFGIIIFNNYIFVPYMAIFHLVVPVLDIPPKMWSLIEFGLSGYIISRGVEKTASILKKKSLPENSIEEISNRIIDYFKGIK